LSRGLFVPIHGSVNDLLKKTRLPIAASALAIALTLAACTAAPGPTPTFAIAPQEAGSASLTLTITPPAYETQYLRAWDWDLAEVSLTGPTGEPVTAQAEPVVDEATGRRSAVFQFEKLPRVAFTLKLKLFRKNGETLIPVAEAEQSALTLGAGANAVTLGAGSLKLTPTQASPQALLPRFVTSVPGAGMGARLNAPGGVVVAPDGTVYISDTLNGCVRRVAPDAQGRLMVTMVAGTGITGFADGGPDVARFNAPAGLVVAPDGSLYVADTGNRVVRKVTRDTEGRVNVAYLRDAAGMALRFDAPTGVTFDAAGTLVVAEKTRLTRVVVSGIGFAAVPLAGATTSGSADGTGEAAQFGAIAGVVTDADGTIWVADKGNNRLRRVTIGETGVATVGTLSTAFSSLTGVALAGPGALYVSEATRVRRLTNVAGTPVLEEVAGGAGSGFANGAASSARFSDLKGLAVGPDGTIYLADAGNNRVRRLITNTDGGRTADTLVGDGDPGNMNGATGETFALTRATGLAVEASGAVVVADVMGHRLVRFAPDARGDVQVTVMAGTGEGGFKDGAGESALFNGPASVAIASDGSFYVTDTGNGRVRRVAARPEGGYTVTTVVSGLSYPAAVAVLPDGALIVTEAGHPAFPAFGNHRILKVVLGTDTPTVTVLAGAGQGYAEGDGATARFNRPTAVAVMPDKSLAIADSENHRLRKLTIAADGAVTVAPLAGTGVLGATLGPALTARFNRPSGLAVDAAGRLYIADYWNHRIQVLNLDGTVQTVAGALGDGYADGPVATARFSRPAAVALGPDGALYVVDAHRHGVRRVAP
jgi:sugar lactone lactonase YvrE